MLPAFEAGASVLVLEATSDNTLFETVDGSQSAGSSGELFAGRLNRENDSIRRGMLRFDVAAALPAGAAVQSATLMLSIAGAAPPTSTFSLHRLAADWGEGTSMGGPGGAPATQGSATWLHTFFDIPALTVPPTPPMHTFWTAPGGDFDPISSATALADKASPDAQWTSTQMASDVQAWLDDPNSDFGWILIGDESVAQTVFIFGARENLTAAMTPKLTIVFVPELGRVGAAMAALTSLAALSTISRRRRVRFT